MKALKPETITWTSTKQPCEHKNGWYKTIYFDWFIFNFKKPTFICTDCHEVLTVNKTYFK